MPLYIGLDSSTQSLSAGVIHVDGTPDAPDGAREIVTDLSLRYDEALPSYGTRNGVFPSDDTHVVHSSPRMFATCLGCVRPS